MASSSNRTELPVIASASTSIPGTGSSATREAAALYLYSGDVTDFDKEKGKTNIWGGEERRECVIILYYRNACFFFEPISQF